VEVLRHFESNFEQTYAMKFSHLPLFYSHKYSSLGWDFYCDEKKNVFVNFSRGWTQSLCSLFYYLEGRIIVVKQQILPHERNENIITPKCKCFDKINDFDLMPVYCDFVI
jgi:hypothetical protein